MNMSRFLSLIFAVLFYSSDSFGQSVLPNGTPLIEGDVLDAFHLKISEDAKDKASFCVSPASGPGFERVWRVESGPDVQNVEDVELEGISSIPVEQGGTALLRLWMRCSSTLDESGRGRVFVNVRKNGVDFNSSLIATLSAGKEWQEYLVPFAFIGTYPEKGAVMRFRFGYPGQTVEIGGVEVVYYGKDKKLAELPRTLFTYAGREPGAQWRKEALERIEQIRKAPLSVRVLDSEGKPVQGAEISVHQVRSAFHFGSALPLTRLTFDTPDNVIFRQKVLELFNEASPENDLKWPVWLGEWNDIDAYTHESAIAGLKWLKAHDFYLRGHVLVWPGWKNLPLPAHALRDAGRTKDILPLIDEHIQEMADATRGLLEEWDVLNEPYTNHDLMDALGPQIMVEWFKTARAAMPGVKLYFNDFSNHDQTVDAAHVAHFEKTTQYLLDKGAPVDGLGLQAHIGGQPNDPVNILATLDRYAKFNLPIRFTEFDMGTEDEPLQADFTRDFFILAYSHPSVVGIQLWGFWEKSHWIPLGAMYRGDWSEKPNAVVYKDLVLHQWRTNVDAVSDAEGGFTVRAFQGDYIVKVTRGEETVEREITLAPGAASADIVITLGQ